MNEVLLILRDFFKKKQDPNAAMRWIGDCDQRKLWAVLTALRGPDKLDERAKISTVGIVRRKVLGLESAVESAVTFANEDAAWNVNVRREMDDSHFRSHLVRAFDALGLEWGKVNENIHKL